MTTTVQYVSTSPNDLLVPPNEIISIGGNWTDLMFKIDPTQNIGELFPVAGAANSRFFELAYIDSGLFFNSTHGMEFRYVLESGVVKTKICVRSSGNTVPYHLSVNFDFQGYPALTFANAPTEYYVSPGDVVRGYSAAINTQFYFTVTDEMLFRYLHYGDDDPPDDDPPDDESAENDPPPTPVFVPRSARRGNLNFW